MTGHSQERQWFQFLKSHLNAVCCLKISGSWSGNGIKPRKKTRNTEIVTLKKMDSWFSSSDAALCTSLGHYSPCPTLWCFMLFANLFLFLLASIVVSFLMTIRKKYFTGLSLPVSHFLLRFLFVAYFCCSTGSELNLSARTVASLVLALPLHLCFILPYNHWVGG